MYYASTFTPTKWSIYLSVNLFVVVCYSYIYRDNIYLYINGQYRSDFKKWPGSSMD